MRGAHFFHRIINKLTVSEKRSVTNSGFTWTCSPVTLYSIATIRFCLLTSPTNISEQRPGSNFVSMILYLCLIVVDSTKSSKKRFCVKWLSFPTHVDSFPTVKFQDFFGTLKMHTKSKFKGNPASDWPSHTPVKTKIGNSVKFCEGKNGKWVSFFIV